MNLLQTLLAGQLGKPGDFTEAMQGVFAALREGSVRLNFSHLSGVDGQAGNVQNPGNFISLVAQHADPYVVTAPDAVFLDVFPETNDTSNAELAIASIAVGQVLALPFSKFAYKLRVPGTHHYARLSIAYGFSMQATQMPQPGGGSAVLATIAAPLAADGGVAVTQKTSPWDFEGDVAEGTVNSGKPVQAGGVAIATTKAVVAGLARVAAQFDLAGRLVVQPFAPRGGVVKGRVDISDGAEHTIIAAGGAAVFVDLVSVVVANTSAIAVQVDIREDTGGAIIATLAAPAGSTTGFTFTTPMPQTTANKPLTAQCAAAVSVFVTMLGRQTK